MKPLSHACPFPDILFFQKNPSTSPVQILTDSIHCFCLLTTKNAKKRHFCRFLTFSLLFFVRSDYFTNAFTFL